VSAPPASPAIQPPLVRIAVVLIYLSGFVSIAIGILVLLSRYRVESSQVLPVSLLGAGVILFGLLTIAVASGIARGRRGARLLLTIYLAAQLVLHVVTIVTADTWDWASIVQILLYVFVGIAVWTPPGSRYFAARPDAAADARALRT
jgi:holin-like protein